MAKKIIVHHLLGQYPMAGIAFQALHYCLGLKRLGFDVYYIEDNGAPPYDPRIGSLVGSADYSVSFLKNIFERFGMGDRYAYFDSVKNVWHGFSEKEVTVLYAEADGLINICGASKLKEEHLKIPVRIYMETDPVFSQMALEKDDAETKNALSLYTHHFTYGENLGNADSIPLPIFDWHKTRPPVVLDLWRFLLEPGDSFTTIATWDNNDRDVSYKGEKIRWSKKENFLKILELPKKTGQKFTIALGGKITSGDVGILRKNGWNIADAVEKSSSLDNYQDFIYHSKGEFTVAKDLVVKTNSGWFSDRSACYLAAGRPVVTEETGFSKLIPTGNGLFSFKTIEEAASAIEEISKNYEHHSESARKIAEDYFDSDKVLGEMIKICGLEPV